MLAYCFSVLLLFAAIRNIIQANELIYQHISYQEGYISCVLSNVTWIYALFYVHNGWQNQSQLFACSLTHVARKCLPLLLVINYSRAEQTKAFPRNFPPTFLGTWNGEISLDCSLEGRNEKWPSAARVFPRFTCVNGGDIPLKKKGGTQMF